MTFHLFTDTPCGRALAKCEAALGRQLGNGEMVNFLMDNFMEIADSTEARDIRDDVVVYFGRTSGGRYSGPTVSAHKFQVLA